MRVRIAINGFGRIGRLVLRQALKEPLLEVVAVNDLVGADNLAYLFKYDSVHGTYAGEVKSSESAITIDGREIAVLNEKDPAKLPWKELKVDYVVESTGRFETLEDASKHLTAGCGRVLITAPAKGNGVPTFVLGVNESKYNPKSDRVLSNASCTTNCLAPLAKVLMDKFGIEEGLMTTVHAMTASQPAVDGPSKRDWRAGRAANQNIIPASTGAAKAVTLCIPELKGKLTGMAFRVPIADVSVVDLTVRLNRDTTYEEICKAFEEASKGSYKGIIAYTEDLVVSSDFIGTSFSAIFDARAGIALNGRFFKLVAWYDNEMGYASRVKDLLVYMAKREE